MHELSSVFLHVNSLDAYLFFVAILEYVKIAVRAERFFVLRDLVPLGKVRIIVVLPGKDTSPIDGAVRRESSLNGKIDDLLVEHGKCPRKTHTGGTRVAVRFAAEFRSAATEDLAFCE